MVIKDTDCTAPQDIESDKAVFNAPDAGPALINSLSKDDFADYFKDSRMPSYNFNAEHWHALTDYIRQDTAKNVAESLKGGMDKSDRASFEDALRHAYTQNGAEGAQKLMTEINKELAKQHGQITGPLELRIDGDRLSVVSLLDAVRETSKYSAPRLVDFNMNDVSASDRASAQSMASKLADGRISDDDKEQLATYLGGIAKDDKKLAQAVNEELAKLGSSLRISGSDIQRQHQEQDGFFSGIFNSPYNKSYEIINTRTGQRSPLVKFNSSQPAEINDAYDYMNQHNHGDNFLSLSDVGARLAYGLPPHEMDLEQSRQMIHDAMLFAHNEGRLDDFMAKFNKDQAHSDRDTRIAYYRTEGPDGQPSYRYQVVDAKTSQVKFGGTVQTGPNEQFKPELTDITDNSPAAIRRNQPSPRRTRSYSN